MSLPRRRAGHRGASEASAKTPEKQRLVSRPNLPGVPCRGSRLWDSAIAVLTDKLKIIAPAMQGQLRLRIGMAHHGTSRFGHFEGMQ